MPVKAGFQSELLEINTSSIVPLKPVTAACRKTEVYRRIAASLEHVGLIEPLVVFPTPKGVFLLLDGNTRFDVLVASGVATVKCLLSTDNECYTYNKRVNYIPPIAQHHMILRALTHVSEERIANALNVSVEAIRAKRDLLSGICSEAAELLRNERVAGNAFAALRKMKPVRQVDVAHLMVNAKKFTGRFARALLDGTPDALLVPTTVKRVRELSTAQQSRMEQETEAMLKHADSIRANYGNDVLDLTAASRYIERVIANTRVRRYLKKHHEETLFTLEQVLQEIETDKQHRRPAPTISVSGAREIADGIPPPQPLQ